MFKKLAIASAVLAASSSVVFAASYKGDYKGEAIVPCPTYNLIAAPYIGGSLGVRNNYSGSPAVFKGLDGNLSLGYGGIIAPAWYLAAEAFVLGTINLKDMPNSATGYPSGSVRSTWAYGLDVLPGYMITNYVMAYLRAGISETYFNNQGVYRFGWRVGAGGQTNIYQNWDLRGEYVYTYHNRISAIGRPNTDLFNVGVVYRFV